MFVGICQDVDFFWAFLISIVALIMSLFVAALLLLVMSSIQGSVCGEIFSDGVSINFLLTLALKEFWKSVII